MLTKTRYDQAPQYASSFGEFNGGALMVETGAREVAAINTRNRIAKCDGRFPHWVLPYEGERFSIIWFMDNPEWHVPKTVAVFE